MSNFQAKLTLVGGPTVIIDIADRRFVTDPTFDPPGDYPGKGVTLQKTCGPAVSLAEVGHVDAVLLSHDQHADNLDHSGRDLLASVPRTYTTVAGARRLGGKTVGMAPFDTLTVAGQSGRELLLTAAPARHGPVGIEPISGDVIGFLLGLDAPGDSIYVTGDTVWYDGTAEVAKRFSPKIVVVFAGSAEPRAKFHMTMDSNDVIAAAHAFPRAKIVAVHNHGWAHFKESGEDLVRSFAALELSHRLQLLEPGVATPVAVSN